MTNTKLGGLISGLALISIGLKSTSLMYVNQNQVVLLAIQVFNFMPSK